MLKLKIFYNLIHRIEFNIQLFSTEPPMSPEGFRSTIYNLTVYNYKIQNYGVN